MIEYLDKVIELREKHCKTYSEIAEEVGISKAWVGMLLQEHRPDLVGREISEDKPELEKAIQSPDELLSLQVSAKTSRIQNIRIDRDNGSKNEGVNLSRRRRMLVKRLWENRLPGPKFTDFLHSEVLPHLETDYQRTIFRNFYLLPIDVSTDMGRMQDGNKTSRSYIITQILPELVKPFNVKSLVEKGILKNGRKSRTSHPKSNGSKGSDPVGS